MKEQHWQAAFWLAMAVLVLTNAAQFYSRRVAIAENTADACTVKPASREADITVGPFQPTSAPILQQSGIPEPLQDGERCINHQRFRKVGNEWLQLAAGC